jgi:superfamily II DNA or RNA helicase
VAVFDKKELDKIQKGMVSNIMDAFQRNKNPICALDMGLGKTRVACNIITDIISKQNDYRILIVIKTSNYMNPWIKELQQTGCIYNPISIGKTNFIKEFENCIYLQGKERFYNFKINSDVYKLLPKYIYIAPYDTLRIDIENNRYDLSVCFDLIIFDELQLIMNTKKETKYLSLIGKLKAHKKLALSGTPGQNTSLEFGLFYIFLNNQA